MKNAKGLAKNPLGIIALFVSLIYGFACLVLSTSISNLNGNGERLPLIWFIIIFPIIILLAFIYLVINHHEKLYSPSDFREDNSFIETMKGKQIKEKHKTEIEDYLHSEELLKQEIEIIERTMVDTQDIESVENIEQTIETLTEKYVNIEKWVGQELSLKHNLDFKTNQNLIVPKMGKFELDAIGQNTERVYIAEIKYWTKNKSDKNLKISIQKFIRNHENLEKAFKRNRLFKLIIVLVFDDLKSINVKEYRDFIKNISSNSIIEFYDYKKLEKDFKQT